MQCFRLDVLVTNAFDCANSVTENKVYDVTTPAVNGTARHLSIVLELNDGSRIDTKHTFEYRNNPNVTDIRPRNHLTV